MKKSFPFSIICIFFLSLSLSAQTPTNGLVAYYPFNNNANDSSGNGNNGTVTGATLTTDRFGRSNSAYSFNGSSNYIEVPNSASLQTINAITIVAWVQLDSDTSEVSKTVVTKGQNPNINADYALFVYHPSSQSINRVNINFGGATWGGLLNGSTSLDSNKWYQIAMTFDGSVLKSFVNGVNDGSLPVSGTLTNSTTSLKIGVYGPAKNVAFFRGKIDDIRIYNRALNAAEVDSLYDEGGYDPSLVAYYPFNGDANDASGNGNNGTVSGATLATDRFGNSNKAYNFVAGNYISVANNPVFNVSSDMTISAWYETTGSGSPMDYLTIVCKRDDNFGVPTSFWDLTIEVASQKMGFFLFNNFSSLDYQSSQRTINTSVWQHVVTVVKNDTSYIYLDGVLDSSSPITIPRPTNTQPLLIGWDRDTPATSESFLGSIDDIRMYSRALSASEILTLYHEGGWNVTVTDTTTRWKMQLKAAIGSALDNENYVGVADSATENFDSSFDMPELPPAPSNYVSLFFPHPEWGSVLGNNFSVDIKKATVLADTVKRWYFQVKSDVVGDTITLTFLNDRIPPAFGRYLTDLKTGQRINLKNTSFYKYSNTSDTARPFLLIIGDSTAPQLTLASPNGSNIWRSGTNKTIQWSTTDGTGIDSIFVYSSANSGTTYALSKSLSYTQSTSWTIPGEYLNHNYSIKVISRDSLGNLSTVKSAKTFSVVGDSLATSSAAGWSLMSLPLQPSDSTAAKIIGDDFPGTPYYLGSYNQSTGYVIPTNLQFGKGYWLGVTSSSTWDVRGAAVEADSTILDLPVGYSIVGSSFVRNVPKQGIGFRKAGVNYSFADAVTQGILVNAIYGYNGTSYETKDTVQMFKGYWMGILQSGVQMIQKPIVSTVTPLIKTVKPTVSEWELPISASSSSQTDQLAKIGVKPNATNDFDAAFDVPRPPRPPGSSYIELYFPHSGQQYPAILGSKYALDYRGTNNPQWSFTVESSDSGQITLRWDNAILTQLGNSVRLTLTDVATSTSIDMAKQNSYAFTYSAPTNFNIASVITGLTSDEEAKPITFALGQNYPNPFNPSTTIRFGLPTQSRVRLIIYNILGQMVADLVNAEQVAGWNQVTWKANVPSGLYFYRLEAASVSDPSKRFVDVKKMLLLK